MKENKLTRKIFFNVVLAFLLGLSLVLDFLKLLPFGPDLFIVLSFTGVVPVIWSALNALFKRHLTVDLLASIALVFAFLAGEWYSATFILLMITFARIFDLWTERRAERIIEKLFKYRPEKVKIKQGEILKTVSLDEVGKGDLVVIESGERVPVDGEVISGQASVDESTLTGESEPNLKKAGSKVFSSTLVEAGSLIVRAERVGEDSTLSKIAILIEEASRKKAKTERLAERFTAWYIVTALAGAVVLYGASGDLKLVLAVLLVICADDIAVAVPLTYSAAIVRAAQKGIVIKGSDVLEKLPTIKTFLTDKTGTLTFGKPKIKEIVPDGCSQKECLEFFALAESGSGHPMAVAINLFAKEAGIKVLAPDELMETPGEGIYARKGANHIYAGKMDYLSKHHIAIPKNEKEVIAGRKNTGESVTLLAVNGAFRGYISSEDKLRPHAAYLVSETKRLGVKKWVMLTGDNEKVAGTVARELGIDSYIANMKPEEKLGEIEKLKHSERGVLGMIGDGVNDAAALAIADVSVAMGAIGSDAAISAADIALMKDDLRRIPQAMFLGSSVKRIIWQNFALWGITNAVGLALVFMGILKPDGAATFNFLTDFLPIMNALRIRVPDLNK